MRQVIGSLLELQNLQLQAKGLSLEDQSKILKLRQRVPAPPTSFSNASLLMMSRRTCPAVGFAN
jgi:hypothetical protein